MRVLFFAVALLAAPAVAQDNRAGRIANSSIGQVGQRQSREQAATGVEPMERANSRINNRVQSRLRNRIDRFYNPQANATSPFEVAGEEVRTAGRRR